MNNKRALLLILTAVIAGLLVFCSSPNDPDQADGGGGYPVPNPTALAGYVAFKNAADTALYERPESVRVDIYSISVSEFGKYSWTVTDSAWTDSSGYYRVLCPEEGTYSVFYNLDTLAAFYGYGNVDTAAGCLQRDTVFIAPGKAVKGELVDPGENAMQYYLVDVIGTPLRDTIFAGESQFNLKNVPAGSFYLNIAGVYDTGARFEYVLKPFMVQ